MLPCACAARALAGDREARRIALEVDDDVLQLGGDWIAGAARAGCEPGAGVGVDAKVRPSRGERRRDDDAALDTAGGRGRRGATGHGVDSVDGGDRRDSRADGSRADA